MCYSMTWKVCLGVLIISVLAWLPQGVTPVLTSWSPALCWAGDVPNPEAIASISVIKGNKVTEIDARNNAIISNSFAGFTGISQVNQAAGSLCNQANAISIGGSLGRSVAHVAKDNVPDTCGNSYSCSIKGGSYKNGAGIAQVNQSAGNMNSQYNGFALNIGTKGKACSDYELSAAQTNNLTQANSNPNNSKTYLSPDSDPSKCSNFSGVWSSNQISGDKSSATLLTTITVTPR